MDVLSAGRSRRSTVNTGKWPELLGLHVSTHRSWGCEREHFPSSGPPVTPLSLFISKLTQCHIDAPSLASPPAPNLLTDLRDLKYLDANQRGKTEFVLACEEASLKRLLFTSPMV
ncbi:unnamed protein product [Pleuronectes platessa]|uniref:Uncharacterized protein n=1 Tax=Pleuronectes platessa TaxID=8262 RepID=A0A9N7TYF0_PLEPL|nr:unnamed protein product [Pleuronectes platessa]